MRTGRFFVALSLAAALAAAFAPAVRADDAAAADTAPYEVGSRLPRIELADQHGETRAVDEGVRFLLFSRDMEGGDVLREAVDDQDAASLARVRAVYLADIHRMPGLVARLIAVPRMRGRAYPMLLDRACEAPRSGACAVAPTRCCSTARARRPRGFRIARATPP